MEPVAHPVTWTLFAEAEPDAAAQGAELLQLGLAYLGTVREDLFPRITPISPIFAEGSIWATIIPSTPKYAELVRCGRYALHALPGPEQQEFCITGRAALAEDDATRARLRSASAEQGVVWEESDAVFELTLDRVFWAEYDRAADGSLVADRHRWIAPSTRKGVTT
jgi:hypothetical protein